VVNKVREVVVELWVWCSGLRCYDVRVWAWRSNGGDGSGLGFSARIGGRMRPRQSVWSGVALLASDSTSPSLPADGAWPPCVKHGLPAVGVDGALKFPISIQWPTDEHLAPCSS
jgi:hypothetical protein